MKIIYLSSSIIPSRTANSVHVMKMCQAFADNGHEVILIAPDYKDMYEKNISDAFKFYSVKNNFKLVKLPAYNSRLGLILYTLSIFLYLLFAKADLVYGRNVCGCYFASLLNFKTIFEAHSPLWQSIKIEQVCFNQLTKSKNLVSLVVISAALKNLYVKNIHLTANKIMVAHDGADEVLDFSQKEALKGEKENLNIGYIGHLYKGRGIELILSIAEKLPGYNFHIVGGSISDIDYWKNKVKKLLLHNIFFYGFVSPEKTIGYRNSFDILLAPYGNKVSIQNKGDTSQYMSPLKIFEYMSHKKPIIVSDIKVLREVLNESNSLLVEAENVDKWVAAINSLKSKSLRAQLGENALCDFKQYTWKNRVKKLIMRVANKI